MQQATSLIGQGFQFHKINFAIEISIGFAFDRNYMSGSLGR